MAPMGSRSSTGVIIPELSRSLQIINKNPVSVTALKSQASLPAMKTLSSAPCAGAVCADGQGKAQTMRSTVSLLQGPSLRRQPTQPMATLKESLSSGRCTCRLCSCLTACLFAHMALTLSCHAAGTAP